MASRSAHCAASGAIARTGSSATGSAATGRTIRAVAACRDHQRTNDANGALLEPCFHAADLPYNARSNLQGTGTTSRPKPRAPSAAHASSAPLCTCWNRHRKVKRSYSSSGPRSSTASAKLWASRAAATTQPSSGRPALCHGTSGPLPSTPRPSELRPPRSLGYPFPTIALPAHRTRLPRVGDVRSHHFEPESKSDFNECSALLAQRLRSDRLAQTRRARARSGVARRATCARRHQVATHPVALRSGAAPKWVRSASNLRASKRCPKRAAATITAIQQYGKRVTQVLS